jgi:hypothetical protein
MLLAVRIPYVSFSLISLPIHWLLLPVISGPSHVSQKAGELLMTSPPHSHKSEYLNVCILIQCLILLLI